MEFVDTIPREYNLPRVIEIASAGGTVSAGQAVGAETSNSWTLDEDAVVVAVGIRLNVDNVEGKVVANAEGIFSHRPVGSLNPTDQKLWAELGVSEKFPVMIASLKDTLGSYIKMRREETLHIYRRYYTYNGSSSSAYVVIRWFAILRVKG